MHEQFAMPETTAIHDYDKKCIDHKLFLASRPRIWVDHLILLMERTPKAALILGQNLVGSLILAPVI